MKVRVWFRLWLDKYIWFVIYLYENSVNVENNKRRLRIVLKYIFWEKINIRTATILPVFYFHTCFSNKSFIRILVPMNTYERASCMPPNYLNINEGFKAKNSASLL